MNELLQKLLEAELLSEETKQELENAFNDQREAAINEAKENAEKEVKAQIAEEWVEEKKVLIESLDEKITEMLTEEISQLKSDIERFRDLEAEYAEKIIETKEEMAKQATSDLKELVEKLDVFLEMKLHTEMEELKEEMLAAKQNKFGEELVNSFGDVYNHLFLDDDATQNKLQEAEAKVEELTENLNKASAKAERFERTAKLKELLNPLNQRQRDVMETVLMNIPTESLEEGFNAFADRVIKETNETSIDEKENDSTALNENVSIEEGTTDIDNLNEKNKTVVTGDVLNEGENNMNDNTALKAELKRVRLLAGIK